MDFRDKKAVITGSSGGIGADIARLNAWAANPPPPMMPPPGP